MSAALATCEAVNTYALELLGYYTNNCRTDRSQCNSGDYNYNTCGCAEEGLPGSASAVASCQDTCVYAFGEYMVQRATTVGAQTHSVNIGSIPTPSVDHSIGFTHLLMNRSDGLLVGKIALGFPPAVQVDRLAPALGGNHYAYWNDQACTVDQVWCNAEQTHYNFYMDCSMYSGGAVLNLCNEPTQLTDQTSLLELALQVPFLSCSDPSLLAASGTNNNNNPESEFIATLPEGNTPVGTNPGAPAASGGTTPTALPMGATSGGAAAAAAAGSPTFALVGLLASMILFRYF